MDKQKIFIGIVVFLLLVIGVETYFLFDGRKPNTPPTENATSTMVFINELKSRQDLIISYLNWADPKKVEEFDKLIKGK